AEREPRERAARAAWGLRGAHPREGGADEARAEGGPRPLRPRHAPAATAARRRSYQRDISSMASQPAEQPTRSEARPAPHPQRSTIHANTVGDAAPTMRTGVAMTPSTAP